MGMNEKKKKFRDGNWSIKAAIPKKIRESNHKVFWWVLGVLMAGTAAGGLALLVLLFLAAQSLPPLENLEKIEPALISRVYDDDSLLIHEFYTERRIWTEYQDIPKLQIQAVMAIEDRKFFDHWGVNIRAYPPALMPALVGKRARGASTLTQQLAKNLFLSPERSILRKVRELILAVKIEQTYTKEEILEFYLNAVYLGAGAYGFQSAAQKYFSKTLDSLSIGEYALLAGLLQRPEYYRPDKHPENGRERRNTVLRAMYSEGVITKPQLVEALAKEVETNVWNPNSLVAPYYVENIRQFLEKKWNAEMIYGKGVNIYSTLDQHIQYAADTSFQNHLNKIRRRIMYRTAYNMNMPRYMKIPMDTLLNHWDSLYAEFTDKFINGELEKKRRETGVKQLFHDSLHYRKAQGAVIVIENKTGAIKAMIGGESFEKSKFNRAIQAMRSPGSSFKPIVYSVALDNGGSPLDSLNDQPITIPDPDDSTKTWRPKNYEKVFDGDMTMREAFYRSKNLPAIKTGIKYGLKTVVNYARRFGLTGQIPAVPSIGIGAGEASLLEMTSAYTVFPNGGIRPEPYSIETINDKDNRVIFQNIPKTHEAIRKQSAYLMLSMMTDVNIRGTAASVWASGFHMPSGGKTGTTNDETDAWYIGYTPYYTCGVWIGADDHRPMGRGHTGTADALPIWLGIMSEIHKDLPIKHFDVPPGVAKVRICKVSGNRAGDFCSKVAEDFFNLQYAPSEVCDGSHVTQRNLNQIGDTFESKRKRVHSTGSETPKKPRNTF